MALERLPLSSGRCRRAQRGGIDRYHRKQAGLPTNVFASEVFELPLKVI